jgi:hypothetical protein
MRPAALLTIVLTLAAASAAAQESFSLRLGAGPWPPRDPRTEARLAEWDSPMGRVAYQVAQQQASVGREGLVGGGQGLALRVKAQAGTRPQIIATSLLNGIPLADSTVLEIHWPWDEEITNAPLPLEQQISLLLGRRLEIQ